MDHSEHMEDDEVTSLAKEALGAGKPAAGPVPDDDAYAEEDPDADVEAETMAAGEMMHAIETKNPDGFRRSLRAFLELCGYEKKGA